MSIADELKKLEELRWNGTLTDAEFAQAKAALLAQLTPPSEPAPANDAVADKLAEQLAEMRYKNELERLDRDWEIEKEQYMVADKNGHKGLPTVGGGIGAAVAIGAFGIFWTVGACSITSQASGFGPPAIFPLFGIAFTVFGIWSGIHSAKKAEAYNQALASYERRRAAVQRDKFR